MLRYFVAAILIAVTAAPAAAALCQKRSGALFVRDACKKRETIVDPVALGLVGPKGDAGPAGEARAFACSEASADGTLVAPCPGRPSKGVVSIVAPENSEGTTCFVLDPSIDVSSAIVLATFHTPFYGYAVNAIIQAHGTDEQVGCPENSVLVTTGRYTPTAAPSTAMDLELIRLSVNIAVM